MIQSICLFPVLRRAGFSMRLRWDLRRNEIGEIGRMAGWMFGYVASQALGNLVVQRAANAASNTALRHGVMTTAYYTIYSNAWQLFQLPYAIVGISVISALLPRMSGHANERRYSLVRDDFSKGVRIASVIVVPAAVFLAVMGAPLCEFLFAHGHTDTAAARGRSARYSASSRSAWCRSCSPSSSSGCSTRSARTGRRPSSAW